MNALLALLPDLHLPDMSPGQLVATALIFTWSGFVRSGLGFGGAALALPFMLLVYDQPVFWIPVIGIQLLFFTGLTLSNRLHNVDWAYLFRSGRLILPAAFAGVFGLLNLPNGVLLVCIYVITLVYAVIMKVTALSFMYIARRWLINTATQAGAGSEQPNPPNRLMPNPDH